MRILLLSTNDVRGGAARAAYRLHKGLLKGRNFSRMLVQEKLSHDLEVIGPTTRFSKAVARVRPALNDLPLLLYRDRPNRMFSCQWFPGRLKRKLQTLCPDVINIHWVCKGFLGIETMAELSQPTVWTLHDMWAFTGGCHYSEGCERYTRRCGHCPQLGSDIELDLSRWVWARKARAWKGANLTIVAPSRWLASSARSSSLIGGQRIEVIPYGLDTHEFRPIPRDIARGLLELPQARQLVLFVAQGGPSNPLKGFHLLESALHELRSGLIKEPVDLAVLGSFQPDASAHKPYQVHSLGTMSDPVALALAYSAADVLVAPSIQDNLPNTVLEALACGTPCVAFRIGGMPDMVEHRENGYLARPFEAEDLARGIVWVIESSERNTRLSHRARQKVIQEFDLELQAQRYIALYEELLEKHRALPNRGKGSPRGHAV